MARFGEALADHSLFLEPPPPDALVEVDPAQLTEALGHGLENAARYSPRGSRIQVRVEADADAVRLHVLRHRTRGSRRRPARARLRAVRAPRRRREGTPGSGLGLSIARSLVELNGGSLSLAAAPGGGTLFEIALPRARR